MRLSAADTCPAAGSGGLPHESCSVALRVAFGLESYDHTLWIVEPNVGIVRVDYFTAHKRLWQVTAAGFNVEYHCYVLARVQSVHSVRVIGLAETERQMVVGRGVTLRYRVFGVVVKLHVRECIHD